MKNKTIYLIIFLLFFGSLAFTQNVLTYSDHTKVMLFALKHQPEITKWINSRRNKVKPSSRELLNFLYKLSNNRSTYDIHLILGKTLNTTSKMRMRRSLNPNTRNLLMEIKNTRNLFQLKQLLSRKTRKSISNTPTDIGIQIANKILQDGINKNLYSANTLRRFAPKRKGRGFWQSAYDYINDLAKDDVMGAITGAVVAGLSTGGVALPEGAVAGAIEGSIGSLAENVFSNIISNPTPAY